MTTGMLWLQMGGATVVILVAAHFLTRAAHVISVRTGLGHSFIGVILLATATSLPELGTGVSSIVLLNAPDLAMGAAFGSNLFNLFIIALLDLYWRQGQLLHVVSRTASFIAATGVLIIALGSASVLLHARYPGLNGFYLAPTTWIIAAAFVLTMYLIYRREQTATKTENEDEHARDMSLAKAVTLYVTSAGTVILGAVWLANTGDGLVQALGWDASFVGTQFLALCTSLPEVATSFAALRMGAVDLAITNVLGSNLFNMGFIVFVNDAVYTQGSVWGAISQIHAMTGAMAILMTGVVLFGLMRPRQPIAPAGPRANYIETILLIALYVVASLLVFYAS